MVKRAHPKVPAIVSLHPVQGYSVHAYYVPGVVPDPGCGAVSKSTSMSSRTDAD